MSRSDSSSRYNLDDLEEVINNFAHETPYPVVSASRQLIANCRAHQRQDRSALLKIAGNVAAGLVQRHTTLTAGAVSRTDPVNLDSQVVADQAVEIARAILAEVDKP